MARFFNRSTCAVLLAGVLACFVPASNVCMGAVVCNPPAGGLTTLSAFTVRDNTGNAATATPNPLSNQVKLFICGDTAVIQMSAVVAPLANMVYVGWQIEEASGAGKALVLPPRAVPNHGRVVSAVPAVNESILTVGTPEVRQFYVKAFCDPNKNGVKEAGEDYYYDTVGNPIEVQVVIIKVELEGHSALRSTEDCPVSESDEETEGIFVSEDDMDDPPVGEREAKLVVKAVGVSGLQRWLDLSTYGKMRIKSIDGGAAPSPAVPAGPFQVPGDSDTDVTIEISRESSWAFSDTIDATLSIKDASGASLGCSDTVKLVGFRVDIDGREPVPAGGLVDVPDEHELLQGVFLESGVTEIVLRDPGVSVGTIEITWGLSSGGVDILELDGQSQPITIDLTAAGLTWPMVFPVTTVGPAYLVDKIYVKATHSLNPTIYYDMVQLVFVKIDEVISEQLPGLEVNKLGASGFVGGFCVGPNVI